MAFQQPNVDRLKDELDHDQFQEWLAFMVLEPQGWAATKVAATRLSFIMAQTHSRRPLRERDFELNINLALPASEALEAAISQAMRLKVQARQELDKRCSS